MEIADKVIIKVLIKELPRMRVATYRAVSSNPERDATNYMKGLIQKLGLNFIDIRKFGVDIPISENLLYTGLRGYECWVCLPDEIEKLKGAKIKNIPRGSYAVLRLKKPHRKPLETIANGWLELYDEIINTDYLTTLHNPNRFMLEELVEVDGEIYLDLYYPVEYANNGRTIRLER